MDPNRGALPKGALINLDSGERLDFQFNPETFTQAFGVNYAKHQVPGLSYEPLNFINTRNMTIPLTLYMSKLLSAEEPLRAGVEVMTNPVLNAKAFLEALVYPIDSGPGGWLAPPQVLFLWPRVVRMICVVTSLNFTNERFSEATLETIALTAELTLEECRDVQRFSADVRREGSEFGINSRG